MPIMAADEPVTLKEVQLRLGVPQHVLIHLCEKGVIKPDFAETSGRGKRREFSQRNVFEFATALALRRVELPVATASFVIGLLRAFATATKKLVPGFALPDSLIDDDLELSLYLLDGERLVFRAGGSAMKAPLLLGADLGSSKQSPKRPRITTLDELPEAFDVRVEVDLTRIAKNLGPSP